MALVKCINCGKEVSDKATTCPQCGNSTIQNSEIIDEPKTVFCPECNFVLNACEDTCPNCGCPIKENDETKKNAPQEVEVVAINIPKNKQKTKKQILISSIIAVALLFVFLISNIIHQNMLKKAATEYYQNLGTASYMMLTGAAESEKACNLIKKVWRNAIYEEYDEDTNKYTRPDGYFVDDFNTALSNLFSDENFKSIISGIESNQKGVAKVMKELKNPPEQYKEAYDEIKEFYSAYTNLTNLATNPQGSLTTFSQNFSEADSETINHYEAMELYLED